MTKTYGPFSTGAGTAFSEQQWGSLFGVQQSGVIWFARSNMTPFADSSGMHVKVGAGTAILQGFLFDDDTEETLTISAANATNPRIDRVVLRRDLSAHTVDFVVKTGTPGSSPAVPPIQRDSTIWELSIARVAVAANVSTIASTNVTDERFDPNVGGLLHPFLSGVLLCTSSQLPSAAGGFQGGLAFVTDLQQLQLLNNSGWHQVALGGGPGSGLDADTVDGVQEGALAEIGSGRAFTVGPISSDWFWVTLEGHGIANSANGQGISLVAGGPVDLHTGGRLWHSVSLPNPVDANAAQTLNNKTLESPSINGGTVQNAKWFGEQVVECVDGGSRRHLESGSVTFNAVANTSLVNVGITFGRAYVVPPVVVVSIGDFSSGQPINFAARITSVTTSGGTIYLYQNSGVQVSSVTVNWMAFGA